MGSSKLKDLKAFVRYDGSGRVVAGSLVFRKNKPKNGRWVEIPKSLCCNDVPTELLFTPTFPFAYPAVTIYCDEVQVAYQYINNNTSITTVDQLVIALNTAENTRAFGTYSNAGPGGIKLTVPTSVKNSLCPNGTLAFTVYAD